MVIDREPLSTQNSFQHATMKHDIHFTRQRTDAPESVLLNVKLDIKIASLSASIPQNYREIGPLHTLVAHRMLWNMACPFCGKCL